MSVQVRVRSSEHKGLPWDGEAVYSMFDAFLLIDGEVAVSWSAQNTPELAIKGLFEAVARKVVEERDWTGDWPDDFFPFRVEGHCAPRNYDGYVHLRAERT